MEKKAIEIPKVDINRFLKFIAYYAKDFKEHNGYGRWLVEYRQMEEQGMFKPEKLKELYIKILDGSSTLSYIQWDAVNYICAQALNVAKTFTTINPFEIRLITGEIALDENDEELKDLSMEEALSICKAMNDEAEEVLFRVYNSDTNKFVK